MNTHARGATKFFQISHVTLADAWGLSRIDTQSFFSAVSRRLEDYRTELMQAGQSAAVGDLLRLHHERMREDQPVDIAVFAALLWAAEAAPPTGPAGGIPCVAVEVLREAA